MLHIDTTTLPAKPRTFCKSSGLLSQVRQPMASNRRRQAGSAFQVGISVTSTPNRRHSFTVCHSSVFAPPTSLG